MLSTPGLRRFNNCLDSAERDRSSIHTRSAPATVPLSHILVRVNSRTGSQKLGSTATSSVPCKCWGFGELLPQIGQPIFPQ